MKNTMMLFVLSILVSAGYAQIAQKDVPVLKAI
jgi:hypothetical protein